MIQGFLDEEHQVLTWRGVPYAAKADGANRWRAPQPAPMHKESLDCTEFAPVNLQFIANELKGSEGILTLDIYRPASAEAKLPILVYFHGGNNQNQSSRIWQGGLIAQQAKIILVSVQSRLDILGFNPLPALKTGESLPGDSGNYGLLDQAAALDWVKANAEALGGDRENITVTGISSGARNIMVMLTSPYFSGKFHKAIPLSGGCTIADEQRSQEAYALKLAPLVVEDGVKATLAEAKDWLLQDLPEVRDYLLQVKAERFPTIMAGAGIRMGLFPHLYGDDRLLPKKGFAGPVANQVPLFLLASTDEFSLYCQRHPFFSNRLEELQDVHSTTAQEFAFAVKYGSLLNYYFNTHQSAQTLGDSYEAPIYVGRVNYCHEPEVVGPVFALSIGAFHGNIMPLLTDQPNPISFFNLEDKFDYPGALELRHKFIETISAFVHTGNPNNAALPVECASWKLQAQTEFVFDADQQHAKITTAPFDFDYGKFYAALDKDNSISPTSKQIIISQVLCGRWFSEPIDKHYHNPSLWPQDAGKLM